MSTAPACLAQVSPGSRTLSALRHYCKPTFCHPQGPLLPPKLNLRVKQGSGETGPTTQRAGLPSLESTTLMPAVALLDTCLLAQLRGPPSCPVPACVPPPSPQPLFHIEPLMSTPSVYM